MNFRKNLFLVLVSSLGTVAFAQPTSQMEVSAFVEGGCRINSQDINFGELSLKNLQNNKFNADFNLTMQCSNDISVEIRTDLGQHKTNNYGNTHTLAATGISSPTSNQKMDYKIYTTNVQDTENYIVDANPNALDKNFPLALITTSGNQFTLPMYAQIDMNQNQFLEKTATNYSDTVILNFSFQ